MNSIPADARRSLTIYNALFPLVFLVLLPSYLLRMVRRGSYREKFGQRLGSFSAEDRAVFRGGGCIWIHSISVGETFLALKLAREIREIQPQSKITLSVTTSTGFAVAQNAKCDWLEVIYNPLDLPAIVRKSLDTVQPQRLIFIEAIWPNLLAECKRRGIPVGFVPRLSPRSERRFRKIRGLVAPLFGMIDRVAVQEKEDLARWETLGVEPARMEVTGNSKFDQGSNPARRVEEFRAVLDKLSISGDAPILLSGSTFPGEEHLITKVFGKLRQEFANLFLILVPRHVERTPAIVSELQPLGFRIALRDSAEAQPADILIVNTTGELRDWYYLSTVVFIGKSLLATGGQNPVEAVMAGKPVLFGPHMENFESIVSRFLAADAAIRVHDAAELQDRVGQLLRDPQRREVLADRAREIAGVHQGATNRTAHFVLG